MIFLRRYRYKDLNDLEGLLGGTGIESKELEDDDLLYLCFIDEGLVGAIRANLEEEDYFLKYLFVAKDYRDQMLGDGLLRVVIDRLERQGLKRLYYRGFDGYLIKRGFREKGEGLLEIDIENFFKAGCGCGMDEV